MMREMKDSGIEWIGEIPADWVSPKAKYHTTITNGSNPITDGDIPVYGSGATSFMTCGEYKLGPTVLLGRKGATLHIPHYIEGKYWNVDTAFDVRTKDSLLLKYYYYLAICFDYKRYISQTTLPGMTQTNYGDMHIPLPQIKEQVIIVSFLDTKCSEIDALAADVQSEIDTLEQYKRSVIFEIVSHGICNSKMKPTDSDVWTSIPEDWELVDIKYLFRIVKRIAGKEGYDILAVTQKGIRIKDISNNAGQIASDYSGYQFVYPTDYVMNHMDLLTGWVDCSNYFGVTSPDYRVFCLQDKEANDLQYYKYVMQCCYMCRIFYSLGQGVSTLGRWRLQTESFLNFKVPVPPLQIQKDIAKYLDGIITEADLLIDKKKEQLSALDSYKKSLIYEYVTGKKEVSGCVK